MLLHSQKALPQPPTLQVTDIFFDKFLLSDFAHVKFAHGLHNKQHSQKNLSNLIHSPWRKNRVFTSKYTNLVHVEGLLGRTRITRQSTSEPKTHSVPETALESVSQLKARSYGRNQHCHQNQELTVRFQHSGLWAPTLVTAHCLPFRNIFLCAHVHDQLHVGTFCACEKFPIT